MAVRSEKRRVYITSDDQSFIDKKTAGLHEANFQLTDLLNSQWYVGIEPKEVVEILIHNSDRVVAVLKELKT